MENKNKLFEGEAFVDTVGIKTVSLNFCNFLCYNDVEKHPRLPCVWKNGQTGLSVERLVWMRLCHFFQRLEGCSRKRLRSLLPVSPKNHFLHKVHFIE